MQLDSESSKNKRKRGDVASDAPLVYAALSDVGLERSVNEDRCSTFATEAGECFLVLDGMGGAEGGEFAAQISADTIQRYLTGEHQEDIAERMRDACEEANRTIMLRRQNQRFTEMGTTVVGVLIEDSAVAVGHVGDSRAYLVQQDGIRQLTIDHTYVQQLVDRNEITREEALPHPQSHILTQCLGSSPDIRVDVDRYWIWPLILCSDGLYSLVADVELGQMASSLPAREACERLIALARERGGYDNISVSIIPFAGMLKPHAPERANAKAKAYAPAKPVKSRASSGFLKHVFFLALMSGLAAVATVAGFFLMKFLR